MGRRKKNRGRNSRQKPKLENKIGPKPVAAVGRLTASAEAIEKIAGLIAAGFGVFAAVAYDLGHHHLKIWLLFIGLWFAFLAVAVLANDKRWAPWLLRDRPFRLAAIAAVVLLLCAAYASSSLKDNPAVTARADLLTPPVREKLTKLLKQCPPHSVGLVVFNDTPEARELGDVFLELLEATGMTGGRTTLEFSSLQPHPPGRLRITGWQGEKSKPIVEAMASLLTDAGFPGVVANTEPERVNVTHMGSFIEIMIKPI